MNFLGMFRKSRPAAPLLYARAVAAARAVEFFRDLGVPDTPDGRFDMIAIHIFLVLRRLRREGEAGAELAQALFDLMFADMDQNLREMGVGDLSVGKRVKALATAFYGRIAAYDAGLDADEAALDEALRRNLYRRAAPMPGQSAAVAGYIRASDRMLEAQALAQLAAGQVDFAPAPATRPTPGQ